MNFFQRLKFKKEIRTYINRPLDIYEILMRQTNDHVVIDAYEFFMKKCGWDCSKVQNATIRSFLLCVLYDGEVGGGGVSQFLSNASGDMSHETLKALDAVGIPDAVKILNKAIELFPGRNVPKDPEERDSIMSEFDSDAESTLDALDQAAWDIDITDPCLNYLQKNKQAFLKYESD